MNKIMEKMSKGHKVTQEYMANEHMERSLTSLVIRDMQNISTMRNQYTYQNG